MDLLCRGVRGGMVADGTLARPVPMSLAIICLPRGHLAGTESLLYSTCRRSMWIWLRRSSGESWESSKYPGWIAFSVGRSDYDVREMILAYEQNLQSISCCVMRWTPSIRRPDEETYNHGQHLHCAIE